MTNLSDSSRKRADDLLRARASAEREVDELLANDPSRCAALLRYFFLLLGGGAHDIGDAVERAERGEEPFPSDLDDPSVAIEFPRALAEVRTEYARRDRERQRALLRAVGLLAVARARGQAA